MAYNFLNRTTYANDPLAQGDFEQFIPQPQSTPLGAGFSDTPFESDLIEMVATDDVINEAAQQVQEVESTVEDEQESDPQVDWELMNMIFAEEPAAAPRQRSYTPPPSNEDDEEETQSAAPAPRGASLHGKITPRIWQYGGKPTKYQFGGDVEEMQRGGGVGRRFGSRFNSNTVDQLTEEGKEMRSMGVTDVLDIPQKMTMYGLTGKYQAPSEWLQTKGYDNRFLGFAADVAFDPMNLIPFYKGNKFKNIPLSAGKKAFNTTLKASQLIDNTDDAIQAATRQYGGTLHAETYEQQRIGLNDPNYSSGVFNTKGTNTFRGLDSYEPVMVTDGSKYKVLHGPEDTAKFSGKVYEQKMQTGGQATRTDSLALYNNANKVLDYYNKRNYKRNVTNTDRDLEGTFSLLDYKSNDFKRKPRVITNLGAGELPKEMYHKDVDANRFFQREDANMILDLRSPMQLYDRRINPTKVYDYENAIPGDKLYGDVVQIRGYDPLMVKPWDMLTPEERKIRESMLPKAPPVSKKPSKPKEEQYVDMERFLKPSTVKGTRDSINIPDNGYSSADVSQKPTKFSATYRGDGNEQKTIYFRNRDDWKNFVDSGALSNMDTSETEGRSSATGYRTMQTGGNVQNDIKAFYNEYINSPNYLDRAKKQGHSNPLELINARLTNLKGTGYLEDDFLGSAYQPGNYTVVINPKQSKEDGMPVRTVASHEYSHVVGASQDGIMSNPLLEMNANEMNAFSSRNKLKNVNTTGMTEQQKLDVIHDSRPSESKADLDALRFRLYEDKIYNTGTEQFSPELLKQAKEKYKDDNMVNRLFQNFSDDDLIYLMNNIAKNNTKNNRPVYG